MSKHQLKSTIRRGAIFGAVFALVAATFAPAASTYADALNPLTERSLTLSSGSPGWNYLDASGNSKYAPPNSGANGKKTGNTFGFRVSSTATVDSFTFQYCTTPAGNCMGPGNNQLNAGEREPNGAGQEALQRSDLEIVLDEDTNAEISEETFDEKFDAALGQPASITPTVYDPDGVHPNMPALDGSEGNFIVLHRSDPGDNWTYSGDWEMSVEKRQTYNGAPGVEADGRTTDKNNFIKLSNAEGGVSLTAGDYVKIIFYATDVTYITNPGEKEFFVKINTYSDPTTESEATLIDGGVTVANVMNRSIEIQTKVLETMDFSVGTVDPNTLDSTEGEGSQFHTATGSTEHSICDPVVTGMGSGDLGPNVLQLGDENGEFSLRTDTTYSTHSYWRLSSNSSGGATVYYSGVTLSNTVGDQIAAIGKTADVPKKGAEQFGLALDIDTSDTDYEISYARERDADYVFQNGADNAGDDEVHATTLAAVAGNESWHTPRLSPLTPDGEYDDGAGVVNTKDSHYGAATTTEFAFDPESTVIPTPFATGTQVLDCVTGKMRYIANIAATTPAGIYTTKINYIAAPQY